MNDEMPVKMKADKAIQYLERSTKLYGHAIAIGSVSLVLAVLSCVLIFIDFNQLWLMTIYAQGLTLIATLILSKVGDSYSSKARSLMEDPDVAKLISNPKGGES